MKSPFFYAVTLNPCLDVNCYVRNLAFEDVIRIEKKTVLPGGKGFNVAKSLERLGDNVVSIGLKGGRNGVILFDLLGRAGLRKSVPVNVAGEIRENYNFFLPTDAC